MKSKIQYLFKNYFEITVFSLGLLLLALMNPETTTGPGLCLLENLGFSYCPGDGLGHSISYTFRGDLSNALQSNVLGPPAIFILGGRILLLIRERFLKSQITDI